MLRTSDNLFFRSLELDRATLDKEKRSVEVSFSSELGVKRWFGSEILLHGSENVDLSRLKAMGSALMNHNPNMIIGKITGAKIDNKQGRAMIIFDDDEDGNRAMRKVESGSLRGVSVGYAINKFREVQRDEEWNGIKGPAYVATRWTPYEISLTPIPADHTVGVGREMTRSLDGIEIERKEPTGMTDEEFKKLIDEERERSAKEIQALNVKIDALIAGKDDKPKMRITPDEYNELLSRATAISPEAVVSFAKWAAEGEDARSLERKLFDLATGKGDAKDSGGSSPDDTGKAPAGTTPGERKFSELDDDALARALKNPSSPL